MNLLAQGANQLPVTPDLFDYTISTLRQLGVPGMLVAGVLYTIRRLVLWALPWAEQIIKAHIKRQQTMEECQQQLTDKTIAIQTEVLTLLKRGVCAKASPPDDA